MMKFAAVLLLATGLSPQLHVNAGELTFCGTNGYFPRGKFCGSRYTFDLALRNWQEARSYCRSQGGDLVSIETAEENEYLKQVIAKNNKHPLIKGLIAKQWWFGFWTSGTDIGREGTFLWTANGLPVTLNNWSPGQPDNNGNNEDYLQIFARDGLWNDVSSHFLMFSICEF